MAKLDLAFQLTANADGVAAGVAQADRELSKVGASAKATAAEFRQAAKITAEMQTPAEKYADTIGKLDKMLAKGLLTQEVYVRAVGKAEAELAAANSRMDEMAQKAGVVERVVNGTATAIANVGNATKAIADAGVSVIAFGKDIAWTYMQWKVFSAIRNPAGLKDFAIGALKGAMAARTMILAAKALGVGMALGGGAVGTAAAAVLGFTNPVLSAALLTLNLGKAFLNAKDRALEMAAGITQGTVTLEQLNGQLGEIQAQQVDNLAYAMEEATAAGERSGKAFAGLGDVFVTPFVGAFAAIQSGLAGLTDGISSVIEGVTSILSPIAQALAPIFTLIGTVVEGVLKLAGVLMDVVGVVLKLAGAFVQTLLSPVIAGWSNLVEAIRGGMNTAFDFVGSKIDWVTKKIQAFYAYMSKVPIIGRAFAGGENPAAAGGGNAPAQMEQTAAAAQAVDEEMQAVNRTIAQHQKHLNDAREQAVKFGDAGFAAGVEYQNEMQRLNEQLEAGILNEVSYAQAADKARQKFDEQIDAIEARNRAAAELAKEDDAMDQANMSAMSRQTDQFFESTKKAEEFGETGRKAAKQYQDGLMDLNAQLQDGRINEEQYNREAAKLKNQYDEQIDAAKEVGKINEEMAKKQADIDKVNAEKAAALGGKSNEALKANDIRSSEGMAQFIALATGREDPAIAENRKTNQKLEEIRKELAALQQEKVDILGAAA